MLGKLLAWLSEFLLVFVKAFCLEQPKELCSAQMWGRLKEQKSAADLELDWVLRLVHMSDNLLGLSAADVMTADPKTIRSYALASEAVQVMNEMQITSLFVVDDGRVSGVLHIHDCLRAGVV